MSDVRRLLITGDDQRLFRWHFAVCNVLNGIERRGQTVLYTCMPEDFEGAMELARSIGVEVKEIVGEKGADGLTRETYPVLLEACKP